MSSGWEGIGLKSSARSDCQMKELSREAGCRARLRREAEKMWDGSSRTGDKRRHNAQSLPSAEKQVSCGFLASGKSF
jgi:hypothetical protein